MMLKEKIMIVGGYGKVGQNIAKNLLPKFPIVIAGRNYKKAESFVQELKNNAEPLELNVTESKFDTSIFSNIKYVIMCLDTKGTSFVKTCIENKVNYVDITATYEIMKNIENLHDLAILNGVHLILSVGLAPGMTNLLTKKVKMMFDNIQRVNISILLGSGEKHGKAAVKWTLENMNTKYIIHENGVEKEVKSFRDSKLTMFPKKYGNRKVYRFPFSDQRTLVVTQGIDSVSTWVCLESIVFTKILSIFKSFYKFGWVRNLSLKLLPIVSFGSERYLIKVEGEGTINNEHETISYLIEGQNEGKGTALVTSSVVEVLYSCEVPTGVHHIDEVLNIDQIMNGINEKISVQIE